MPLRIMNTSPGERWLIIYSGVSASEESGERSSVRGDGVAGLLRVRDPRVGGDL